MNFLKQPYPSIYDTRSKVKTIVANGILVSLFLWVFRPFDINSSPVTYLDLYIVGFGAVTMFITSLGIYVGPAIFPLYFKEEGWTVGKNIFYTSFVVFIIGLGNLYYAHLFTGTQLSVKSFFAFQFFTLSVTFFLTTTSTFIDHNLKRKKNINEAETLNLSFEDNQEEKSLPGQLKEEQIFNVSSENEKEQVSFSENSLMYVQSADNYSKFMLIKEGNIQTVILRTSLKRVEEELIHPVYFRCHRSYIVNLKMICAVSGNAQGYRLHLKNVAETIPVSRKFKDDLSARLKLIPETPIKE